MLHDSDEMLVEMQAQLCRALSEPKRLRIVYSLMDGERSVGELAEAVSASMANTSQHLSVLRGCGLLAFRREGTTILYSLSYPEVREACMAVRGVLLKQLSDSADLSTRVLDSPGNGRRAAEDPRGAN